MQLFAFTSMNYWCAKKFSLLKGTREHGFLVLALGTTKSHESSVRLTGHSMELGYACEGPKRRGDPCEVWFVFNQEGNSSSKHCNPVPEDSYFTPY